MAAGNGTFTQPVPNLVQGVSQQGVQQRRDSQCEDQYDCINSALTGATARPPLEVVKVYPGLSLSGAYFSEYSYASENYLLGVKPSGSPLAIDLADGTECTITNTAPNYNYLTSGTGPYRDKFCSQAVDSFLFLGNKQVLPAMSATTSAAKVNEALIFVRATAFNSQYKVTVAGDTTATVTIETGASTVAPTDKIALAMHNGTVQTGISIVAGAALNGQNGYETTLSGSVFRVRRTDGGAFSVTVSDGSGDTHLLAFNGEASSFEEIPARGFNGTVLQVRGTNRTGTDDFYVKFSGATSTGTWVETVAPGVLTTINKDTMPHALVITAYRTFEFRRLDWSTRIAGDADTAEEPGFIGRYVKDLLYHERRLGVLWEGGVDFSKSRKPFTFFPDTVQTVLDTAPVNLEIGSGSGKGTSLLDFALATQENLFLWSQGEQFRVSSSEEKFKQDTVQAKSAMSYEYSDGARPVPIGSFVALPTDVGDSATLRILQFAQAKLVGDVDVSSHVANYIPSGVRMLAGSDTLRQVFIVSDTAPTVLTLFEYTYSSNEGFVQTAFNKWRIPGGTILWAGVKKRTLRILQQRTEGVVLLQANLSPGVVDPVAGAEYTTRLDMRLDETGVTGLAYNSVANTSSFTLPYTPAAGENATRVIVSEEGPTYIRGKEFPVVSVVGAVVTVTGDLTPYSFYVGQKIVSERWESEFFYRTDAGPLDVDRLTIDRFKLNMSKTGYTRIEVHSDHRPTTVTEFTARTSGLALSASGTVVPGSGSIDAPVGGLAKEVRIRIVNDSYLPSSWQSAMYSGYLVGGRGAQ